ncbi:MAG: flagellar basal body rod protein FlgB [Alphaproteobacteria bacterium]|nr:flagellar basal body rod protein FlgB [Alphaproteobacteria bacterium]
MDFNNVPIMQMMTKRMSWLSRRTEIIAQNVANADTPGFKARDLKPVNFREMVDREAGPRNAGPRLTNARHLTGTRAALSFDTERAPDRFETSINGNDVSLEQQLTRLGQTQLSYQATTNLYRKHLDMFRIALGRGR